MAVAILVGVPASLRARVERHVGRRIDLRVIPIKQDGGYRLEAFPDLAARQLGWYSDLAPPSEVFVLMLPYAHIPDEVSSLANMLVDLGASVMWVKPNSGSAIEPSGWPARAKQLDKKFQDDLFNAICCALDAEFPEEVDHDADKALACEIIRGLAVHSKMGPNNHSHEDDIWRACGHKLGPGEKERVLKDLLSENILSRKKNKSMGGTGWVYWIEDIEKSKAYCPALEPYFR